MARRRLAHGCAIALFLVCLLIPAASANTITTVAGGGGLTPLDYLHFGYTDPLTYRLPAPTGVVWSGNPTGQYYVTTGDGTCVMLWQEFNSADNDYGMATWGGTWKNCGVQIGGYPTPAATKDVRLANPCCVTSAWRWDPAEADATMGPLVASTDSGHINFYEWTSANQGKTIAGSTAPSDCNSLSLEPEDNVAPTSAHFCNITALAQQFQSPHDYAFAERNRGVYTGVLYFVDTSGPTVKLVSKGQLGPTSFGALAWDRFNRLYASDGDTSISVFLHNFDGTWTIALIAGLPGGQQGFSGDGGTGPNARFANPSGLAFGFDNALYIADTGNCRIRKIEPIVGLPSQSKVSTIAGNGCDPNASLGDGGPSAGASLDHPVGVAIAPIGLLITDTGHDRVRLIDRTSIIDPPAITADSTPTFDIRSLDTPSHILCKVDNSDVPCGGIGPLLDGPHTLKAWENGNAAAPPDPPDPTPAVANFTVDTTGPTGVGLVSPAADAGGVPADSDFSWTAGTDAYAGVDHYELWINGAKDRDVPTSACANGTCVAKAARLLEEGRDTWQIRPVDKLGNPSQTETRSLTAGGAPKAAFSVSPNPALAGRTVTFDASASADESGIARYEWDLDGDGAFETDGGTASKTARVYPTPTSVTIRLRVTDGVGNQSATQQTLKVTQPPGAQNLLGVTINEGAQYTRDPNVVLTVKPPSNANAFLVSNDGGFLAPATFPAAPTVKWKLDSSGPERLPKTVYLRFQLGPIISDNYTDDIILDEIPPVVQQASLLPLKRAAGAARAAAAKTYTVKVKAKDSNSGVSKVQVTASRKKPGKLLAYKTTVKVKSGSKPKFVRAQDRAGNFSGWKKLR
jgi:hypothetical protein